MKNRISFFVVCLVLFMVVLGCSSINPLSEKSKTTTPSASNKSLTDKGVDAVVGEDTTGIPECDVVMDMIAAETNNPDDGYIAKAGKAVVLNKIKEAVRRSIEEAKANNGNAELVKTCGEFKTQLQKFKTEQEAKGN
ncbi:MAG: hypothetical protein IPL32_02005 [Chloracidobacterium sp.]|nr:hypothetical protein [Chloracidobacterium sp.]